MENITFKRLRNLTKDEGREMLESIRWNGSPVCPYCNSDKAYKLTPKRVIKSS